ncbi:MAG: hypothetical protein GY841_05575, partial [FCB group bacterium]|nr:hypothetical protein [FCB group bacterium]
ESETGLTVPSVAGPGILGGTITESYFIECANGAINEYRFVISPTNFAATVYDDEGTTLGSIKVYGTESDAHLEYWTPDDFVSIGVAEDYSGITFHITDDLGTESVAFQNTAEIDQTSALLSQLQDEGTPEYSSYEQELMEKGNFWINAIESKTGFIDGELSTALELLSSNSVFDDLGDNPSLPATWHCGRACICAIAGIIAHSCFAVPWCVACWVICVPAAGIAAACLLADLIEGDKK